MSDQQPDPDEGRNPVVSGLVALVAVALLVGVVIGGGALVATRVLGLGGGEAAVEEDTGSQTLYIPQGRAVESEGDGGLDITPGAGASSSDPFALPDEEEDTKKDKKTPPISLSSGQTSVGAMQPIYLSGVYPGGEGAILQVQQFEGGGWQDFPVTAPVSNRTFNTYVQTGQSGENRFRVVDNETGTISNEIKVRVG